MTLVLSSYLGFTNEMKVTKKFVGRNKEYFRQQVIAPEVTSLGHPNFLPVVIGDKYTI